MSSQPQPLPTKPTHVSVTFVIVTPDQLRQITFILIRSSDSRDDSWNIQFQLAERNDPTQPFYSSISLAVAVDHNDNGKAAATCTHGLDSDQHAQVITAGDTAKDAQNPASGVTLADAQQDAMAVVTVRNPNSPS